MKRLAYLLLILFGISWNAGAREKWKMYTISDTIPIKKINQKKLFKEIEKWFGETHATKLVRVNPTTFELQGKSYFVYYNRIVMEDIFLSPRAAERTTGSIQYEVNVKIQDSIVIATATKFSHEAYYSPYGQISFGEITDYETTPPGKCLENKVWCNKVWAEMKERSEADVMSKFATMVPDIMVRRQGKTFKIKEEVAVDSTPKTVDPKAYLNLDNYLIKEDE